MEKFVALTVVVTAGLVLYILLKLRRLYERIMVMETSLAGIEREVFTLYPQLEARVSLDRLLNFAKPLPPLRNWAASPDFLLVIARDALSQRPQVIVECSSGTSTLTLARCCEMNGSGHVFSLEHDPKYAEITRSMLREQNLAAWATIVDAPLQARAELDGQTWYDTEGLRLDQGIDLLVIDGPPYNVAKLARYPALPLLYQLLSASAVVYLDDADRVEERAIVDRWLREFPALRLDRPACEKGCAKLSLAHIPALSPAASGLPAASQEDLA